MGKLKVVNDNFLVELERGQWVGEQDSEEGIRQGIVREISDFTTFFGFYTFMFDDSLMNEELLKRLHDKYSDFVGKRVYWPERSEAGTIVKYEGKEYAFIKWSTIMAVEEN